MKARIYVTDSISLFVDYAGALDGDEKGEAQVFCDRFFQAFGHKGYEEAGATLEYRIEKGRTTSFADLIWKPRLLIEKVLRQLWLPEYFNVPWMRTKL